MVENKDSVSVHIKSKHHCVGYLFSVFIMFLFSTTYSNNNVGKVNKRMKKYETNWNYKEFIHKVHLQ